jgi:hypothetical protein
MSTPPSDHFVWSTNLLCMFTELCMNVYTNFTVTLYIHTTSVAIFLFVGTTFGEKAIKCTK